MAESIDDSLARLRIDGGDEPVCAKGAESAAPEKDGTQQSHDVSPEHSQGECALISQPQAPALICDAWYGFPPQARPRKERINAVSRQLSNFLEWRSSSSSSDGSKRKCDVSLLGEEGDVRAVCTRVCELEKKAHNDWKMSDVDFQSNIQIHQFIEQHNIAADEVVYLSPDASETLSAACPPPRAVIVGMLIDRRVTIDRSRIRAEESLKLRAVKLPLDELNVKELSSSEPLNVDTVMELMQRWWWNCDRVKVAWEKSKESDAVDGGVYRRCFLEAAAWAMKTQRERHPNRTLHRNEKG